MATLGRRLCYFALFFCCAFVSSKGEKWRSVMKAARHCDGPPLAAEYNTPTITYSNNGKFFHVDGTLYIRENITVVRVVSEFYRSGNTPVKILAYDVADACSAIMNRDKYTDPLFAPGALPRTCKFQSNQNITFHMDFDCHGDLPTASYRGPLIIVNKVYGDIGLIFCVKCHFVVTRDTLN